MFWELKIPNGNSRAFLSFIFHSAARRPVQSMISIKESSTAFATSL